MSPFDAVSPNPTPLGRGLRTGLLFLLVAAPVAAGLATVAVAARAIYQEQGTAAEIVLGLFALPGIALVGALAPAALAGVVVGFAAVVSARRVLLHPVACIAGALAPVMVYRPREVEAVAVLAAGGLLAAATAVWAVTRAPTEVKA